MKDKPTISLCMIVKDEQDFIEDCLKSISPLIDEIIIVDTGSKDDTIKIAKSFGAKFIDHKWDHDFSEARNVSLKHATKDWVLILDADEKISEKDFENILSILRGEEYDAFYLIQRNYLKEGILSSTDVSSEKDGYQESKGYIGWSPSEIIRLFRNKKGYLFNKVIHESVDLSIKQKNGKIKNTSIPIHHFKEGKQDSFKQDKTQKYFELCKKQVENTPKDPKAHYDLGLMYQVEGDIEAALTCFEKAIKLMSSDSLETQESKLRYASIIISLGETLIKKGDYKQAVQYLIKGINIFPESPILLSLIGRAYKETSQFLKAIVFYQQALNAKPDDEGVYHNLVDLYLKTKQPEKAIIQLNKACKYFPKSAIIYRNLGVAYLRNKEYSKSYASFIKAIKLNPSFKADLKDILNKLEEFK